MWRAEKGLRIPPCAACLFLGAALCLTACSGGEEKGEVLLYEAQGDETVSGSAVSGGSVIVGEDEIKTAAVRRTTYKEEFADMAEIEYLDTESLYIIEEGAVLDAVKVKPGQKVKKGDVLAVYHVETSETSLQKLKLLTDQARADYEMELSGLKRTLSGMKEELGRMKSKSEQRMKQLEIKKMQKQIDAYKKGEKEVADQEKEYARLLRMQKGANLVAKKSGVITETAKSNVGEEIDSSMKIIEMRNNNKWVLRVSDPDSKLRYNMEVSVRLGKSVDDYREEVKGKVITAGNLTEGGSGDETGGGMMGGDMMGGDMDDGDMGGNESGTGGGDVYIEIRDKDKKKYDFENQNIYVYAVSFSVENALVTDAKAVFSESVDISNRLYVLLLENGKMHKRFIVSNYRTEKEVLIDQGVFEGQTLVVLQ